MKKTIMMLMLLSFALPRIYAQDDLMKMLDDDSKKTKKKNYATATFKTSRLINGHSIENVAPGVLDLKISHRFGMLNRGAYELFGLDQASMRIGLDYGISKRLMVGAGRSTYQKQYDAFAKFKILRQAQGGSPISVSAVSTVMLKTLKWDNISIKNYYTSRLSFAHQLIIARKFSDGLSLQLMPSFIHYNIAKNVTEPNDIFALGGGGRIKLNKRLSFNVEYYHVLPISIVTGENYRLAGTKNSLAVGFDIETGGHVFQLHFTNSTGMTEKTFITETTGDFFKGDVHFGFNVSRVFTIKTKKKK
ncbi:MAG: DUF5777 family beta-barrel protein [Sphingobacteriales bacterium]|nr:DUF5777 family beta-barrel protein [Sphingobacteriales bacterium]